MTDLPTARSLRDLHRDPLFALALLAGPLLWLTAAGWLPGPAEGPPRAADGWTLLLVAGVYPVLEEWLFRGLLQPQLLGYRPFRRRMLGLSGANLLVSILFAALHLLAQPPLWAIAVFPPSLVFGAFRDRYDSVVPSMTLHVFYNLGFFLLV